MLVGIRFNQSASTWRSKARTQPSTAIQAHGYAGRETLLHIFAERINWFDKYVKNAPPREKKETAAR